MREVELKSVVDDVPSRRALVEGAGGRLVFDGRLEDKRFDSPTRALAGMDHVLRVRIYRDDTGVRGSLDWKGPTGYEDGYKVRDEISTAVGDPDSLGAVLERLGYVVTREIDRDIAQYTLGDAVVRFERYPRMDALVEVEGQPEAIELAIAVLALPRHGFTSERLPEFAARFALRTGVRPALCDEELAGIYRFSADDA